MSKSNYEPFVLYENSFFELDSAYRLMPDELKVYGYLCTKQRFDNAVTTSCDLIIQQLGFLNVKSKQKDMVEKLINILLVLKDKGLIEIEFSDDRITRYAALEIKLLLMGNRLEGGYVPISYDLFRQFSDPYELYIFSMVKKFDGAGELIFSFGQWAKHLDLSRSTAQDKVNRMIKNGFINRVSGEYNTIDVKNKIYRQDVNKYTLVYRDRPVNNEYVQSQTEETVQPEQTIQEESSTSVSCAIQWGNWRDRKRFLTEDDVYLYWNQIHNDEFKRVCDKRRNDMMKPKKEGSKPFDFTSWDASAKERIESEKRIENKKHELETNAIILYDSNEKLTVNYSNIDSIDFEEVAQFFFVNSGTLNNGLFVKIAGSKIESRDELTDSQFRFIVKEYKNIVRSGKMANIDDLMRIRTEVSAV